MLDLLPEGLATEWEKVEGEGMSEHTPGPWEAVAVDAGNYVVLLAALEALDELYCGFAEVVRTEDWGDGWYPESVPEVRRAFTLAAEAIAKARGKA